MKIYTYSEARQHLSELLNIAEKEEVVIKRRDGKTFTVKTNVVPSSPFDVPGIDVHVTTGDILDAIAESREGRNFSV